VDNSCEKLKEETLWMFFRCLVDGISIMSKGAEYEWNPSAGPLVDRNKPGGKRMGVSAIPDEKRQLEWETFVHFDIKPENSKTLTYFI
jgi:hypothetical protein